MSIALYRNRHTKVKMRKLHIKRIPGSLLEPANPSTHTFVGARDSRPSTKSPVLETIGEIVCLAVSLIVGLLALVVL